MPLLGDNGNLSFSLSTLTGNLLSTKHKQVILSCFPRRLGASTVNQFLFGGFLKVVNGESQR